MKTGKLIFLAMLAGAALIIFVAEAQIPAPVPVYGVKLGLSNVMVLVTLCVYGRREALAVLAVKIIFGAVFSGNPSAVLYSAAGGAAAFGTMAVLKCVLKEKQLWALSAFGAIAHNIGQLAAAMAVLRTVRLLWYAPILLLCGIITGVFTGLCAGFVIPTMRKIIKADRK